MFAAFWVGERASESDYLVECLCSHSKDVWEIFCSGVFNTIVILQTILYFMPDNTSTLAQGLFFWGTWDKVKDGDKKYQ